jgi:NAD(P)-dependent dehydrogenase (short-subunit alcohol dehydrogenase family)
VRALAACGAAVIAVDRDTEQLADLDKAVDALACDMHETSVAELLARLEDDGGSIDIVVTCPPTTPYTHSTNVAELRQALALILEPAWAWTSAAASAMTSRRAGAIVHITGLSGLGGWRGQAANGAAFAAIHNMVRSFAVELAESEVRVNALAPGVDASEAHDIALSAGRTEREVDERIPLRSPMPAAALADALIYLSHPSSTYVSGQVLAVDGGWSTWGRLHAVAS